MSDKKIIQVQAIMRDKGTLSDNTRRLQFDCQETSPEAMFEIVRLSGQIGWLSFKENIVKTEDVEGLPQANVISKESWAQKQRNAIYRLWEKMTGQQVDFNTYYAQYMAKSVQNILDNID